MLRALNRTHLSDYNSSQLSGSAPAKKGRKLSSVWRNRNEGKATRSQSVDAIRASRSDSSPCMETAVIPGPRQGSITSTLDTGFFGEKVLIIYFIYKEL
jgi:uncharacterized protein YacL